MLLDLESDLVQFTGTENYYRHKLVRGVLWTDGIQYLIEKAKCGWLIDAIASYQFSPRIRNNELLQEFQLWELNVTGDDEVGRKAVLTCRVDKGMRAVITQKIEVTDFPLPYIKLFVESGGDGKHVILLSSEH